MPHSLRTCIKSIIIKIAIHEVIYVSMQGDILQQVILFTLKFFIYIITLLLLIITMYVDYKFTFRNRL